MGEQITNAAMGKQAKHLGEAVFWRRKPSGGALGKLSVAWSNGVFSVSRVLAGKFLFRILVVFAKPGLCREDQSVTGEMLQVLI